MEDIPVSIKEYFDTRLNEQRLYFESKFEEREKRAVDARSAAFERLDRLNETSESRDQALRTEIRRLETALALYTTVEAMQSLAAKVAVIDEWKSNMTGRLWAMTGALVLFQILLTLIRAHLYPS